MWPAAAAEAVTQLVGRSEVVNVTEAFGASFASDALTLHFPCQPLVPFDVLLDPRWKPALEADVYEPELGADEVEVEVEALAPLAHGFSTEKTQINPSAIPCSLAMEWATPSLDCPLLLVVADCRCVNRRLV